MGPLNGMPAHTGVLEQRLALGSFFIAQSDAASPWLQASRLYANKCHMGPWASTFSLHSLHTSDLGYPGDWWVGARQTYG